MSANEKQVGGTHYQSEIQHWDWVNANDLDYFQGCITGYVARWKKKNGLEDLRKAKHFLEKYIELNSPIPVEQKRCIAPSYAIGGDGEPILVGVGSKFEGVDFREPLPAEEGSHINRGECLTITKDQVFPPVQQELKYAPDYQEQLAEDMAKMRNDAMRGIPDHIRKEIVKPWNFIGFNKETGKFGYRCLSCKHDVFSDEFGIVPGHCPECGYDGDGYAALDKGYVAQE